MERINKTTNEIKEIILMMLEQYKQYLDIIEEHELRGYKIYTAEQFFNRYYKDDLKMWLTEKKEGKDHAKNKPKK